MTVAQQRAIQNHRERLKRRGLARLEVQASESDKTLIRKIARLLRGDPSRAAEVRRKLEQVVGEETQPGLKALLASAPLEGIDLSRERDVPRDIDL